MKKFYLMLIETGQVVAVITDTAENAIEAIQMKFGEYFEVIDSCDLPNYATLEKTSAYTVSENLSKTGYTPCWIYENGHCYSGDGYVTAEYRFEI